MKRSLTLGLFLFFAVSAVGANGAPIGYIKELSGTAFVISEESRRPAQLAEPILLNDTLETASDGALGVLFIDDSRLSIGADTSLTIDEYVYVPGSDEGSFISRMARGTLLYVSGLIAKLSPESARVETPVGTIGIRGTRFLVKLEWDSE